jgi:hypothetical protein
MSTARADMRVVPSQEESGEKEGLVDGRQHREQHLKRFAVSVCTNKWHASGAITMICWGALFALSSNLLPLGLGNLYVGLTSPGCIPVSAYAWTATSSLILAAAAQTGSARPAARVELVSKSHVRNAELLFFGCNALVFFASVLPGLVRRDGLSGPLYEVVNFWGAKAAWPSYWNLLVLACPTVRVGGVLAALGISHDSALRLHILAGHGTFWWLMAHTILLSLGYALQYRDVSVWLSKMVPGIDGPWNRFTEAPINFAGWVGFAFLLVIWASSTVSARRSSYRIFAALHFLGFGFLFAANLHDYNTLHFAQPGIVAWLVDTILRRTMRHSVVLHRHSSACDSALLATIESNGDHCAMSLPVADGSPLMSAPQGSFLYVLAPQISGLEWHPLSMTKLDSPAPCIFLAFKLVGPWTKALAEQVLEVGSEGLTICFEGPYGAHHSSVVGTYSHALFMSGGAGLAGIAGAAAEAQEHGTQCSCIWVTQHASDAIVYAPLLCMLTRSSVQLLLFFTRSQADEHIGALRSAATRFDWNMSQCKAPNPLHLTLSTCLGFFIGLFLARSTCCFRPASAGGAGREVAVFGKVLDKCSGEACTLHLCWLCFRGLPIVVAFCLAYAFSAATLKMTKPGSKASSPMAALDSLRHGFIGALAVSTHASGSSDQTELSQASTTWGRPNVDLEIRNWSMGLPSGSKACVVVCGPPSLHASVKHSVNTPWNKHIDLLAVSGS